MDEKRNLTSDEDTNEILLRDMISYVDTIHGIKFDGIPTTDQVQVHVLKAYADKEPFDKGHTQEFVAAQECSQIIVALKELQMRLNARLEYIDVVNERSMNRHNHDTYAWIIKNMRFRFPNSHRRYRVCINKAFESHGFKVVDIQFDGVCWTYVLLENGDLWIHDTSHGGGGNFSIDSRAK